MRERLDCAVLLTRCTLSWTQPILGQHAGGRLHLHGYDVLVDIDQEGAHAVLGQASMALRRYDACLLPVSPATLSWARTSLSHAGRSLHTPVMALVRDLTATGLHDLYGLGVADFLRSPFCGHEARVRVERLLDAKRAEMLAPAQLGDAAAEAAQYAASLHGHPDDCRADMPELEAFAVAAASHCEAMRDTFRDAKSKVVERFERAYITAALGRHEGNITMAARSAQKHRRAFWALMRKHNIDATPFRPRAESAAASAARSAHAPASEGRSAQVPACRDVTRQHRPGSAGRRLMVWGRAAGPGNPRGG